MIYFSDKVECVRLVKLTVPVYKFIGDETVLTCKYDLEGEELYSVKWYKDGNEFYRYIPGERDQKVTIFNNPGIKVDVSIKILQIFSQVLMNQLCYLSIKFW